MKRLLCFLTALLLILGSANAQCITMSPSNVNAVVDGNLHQYKITFANAGLTDETLYSLRYEFQYEGQTIPDAELGQYIDLDTSHIRTMYSTNISTGSRITNSVGFFPSVANPLNLGFNISASQINALYGKYLKDNRESISFYIRWKRTGNIGLKLSLYTMGGGQCHQELSFMGVAYIGASNATLGNAILYNNIVTPKNLNDTTIYICYGEAFSRGDWTLASNFNGWEGTDATGCAFITNDAVHFYATGDPCNAQRLDSTQRVTVKRRPQFTATLNNGDNDNKVICTGTSAGYVYMTISGTSQYSVYNGQTSLASGLSAGTAVKVGNLSAGTYNFTVTDTNNCSVNVNGSVSITASPTANTYTINTTDVDIVCNGASTGSITTEVVAAQGNATATPYSYQWSNSSTDASISNLTAGTYTVTMTDNMGCTASKSVTLTENAVLTSTKSVECCASALPYHYPTQGEDTIFTAAGTKVVKFASVNGCDSLVTVTLTVNQNPVPTISGNNAVCKDGEITLTTEANKTSYTWTYTGATLVAGGTSTDNTIKLKWSTDGEKSVTVNYTDAKGCSAVTATSKSITVNALPDATLTVNPAANSNALTVCAGSTVTITAADGYTYAWKKESTTLSETSKVLTLSNIVSTDAGKYSITLTNPTTGCTANSDTITLTVNTPAIALNSISGTTTICNGASTELTASTASNTGVVTYVWNTTATTAAITVSPSETTEYTVTATATNTINSVACTATDSKSETVTVYALPQITASTVDASICAGQQTATITSALTAGTAGNNVTYSWLNGSNAIANATSDSYTANAAGSYKVAVVDAQGCKDTSDAVVITVNTLPTVAITTNKTDNSICAGQENITLTANVTAGTAAFNGGYVWNTQETTQSITVNSANTYSVVVTDAEGCTATEDTTIVENALPTVTVSTQTPTICNGNTATITSAVTAGTAGTTGMEYQWTKDGSDIANATTNEYGATTAGSYNVNIEDAQGCTATATVPVSISINPLVSLTLSSDSTQTICAGSSIQEVEITFANATVAVTGLPTGISYNQVTNKITGSCNVAGTYRYTVTATSNQTPACDPIVKTGTITVNANPTATFTTASTTICSGSDYTITPNYTGTATLTYAWYKGTDNTPVSTDANLALTNITETATYHVVVTDGNTPACTAQSANFTITVNANPTVVVSTVAGGSAETSKATCLNNNITLYAVSSNSAQSYKWYKDGNEIQNATNATLPLDATATSQSGSYTVKLIDNQSAHCEATSEAIAVTVNALPQPTLATGLSVCANSTDFPTSVALTTIDDMNTYVWSLSNSGTYTGSGKTINASWTATGTVTASVTVTDANGCVNNTSTTVTVNALPTAEVTSNDASICLGQQTAVLDATVGQGYTYLWSNDATTQEISVTPSEETTYTVTITDGNGCKAKASKTVTINQLPTVSASADDNNICPGQQSATITATPVGGTGAYSYAWSNAAGTISGQTASTYTASVAGNYTVVVTDAEGCTATSSAVAITENAMPTVAISGDDATCSAVATTWTANGQGGTGTLSYAWSNGTNAASTSISGTTTSQTTASYIVTVTDAQNCYVTASKTITINPLPTVAIANGVETNVCKGTPVTISLDASNDVTSYSWKKNDVEVGTGATYTFTANGDSTYTVTVSTANGCTASTTYTGHAYALPTITSITPTDLTCNADNSGKVNVVVSGGQPGYTFAWSDGAATPTAYNYTSQNLTGLAAGNYQVVVTDNNGCKATSATVTVGQPDALSGLAATVDNVKCNGGNTGSITVTASSVTGGTIPYMYKLTKVVNQIESEVAAYSFNSTFENLYAGDYKVYVKDANNCSMNIDKQVTEPAELTIAESTTAADHKNVTCNGLSDGEFKVTITGGTSTYKYSKDNGSTWTAATSDTYYTFTGLAASNYTAKVEDANGCTATVSSAIAISQPNQLVATITTANNLTCNGNQSGSIDLTVSGGTTAYTYSWSGPSSYAASTQDLSGLAAGTYNVTVTDAHQCTATTSATLSEPTVLTVSEVVASHQNVSCYNGDNGSITVSATGGTGAFTYSLNSGSYQASATFNSLTAGTNYVITAKDANGCTASTSAITITQPSQLVATITTASNLTCNGNQSGSIDLTVSGGITSYTYSWSGPSSFTATSQDLSNLAAGTYNVTVTDAHSCTATTSATLTEPAQLTVSEVVASHRNVDCNGNSTGAITVSANGGNNTSYQYKLNSGSYQSGATFTGLAADTNYVITVKDANNCEATTSAITISEPTTLSYNTPVTTDILCKDSLTGTITVTATGGTASYKYKIDNQQDYATSNTFTGLAAGQHTVYIKDDSACTTSVQVTLTEPATSPAVTATPTDVKCNGDSTGKVVLAMSNGTVGDGYQYKWNNGSFVSATNATATIENLSAGTYSYQIMDGNGCKTASADVTVSEPNELTISETVASHVDATCHGDANGSFVVAAAGGTTPYSYKRGTTDPQSTGSYSNLAAGTYNVVVTDANQCTANVDVIITEPAQTTVTLTRDTAICLNKSVTLTAVGTTDNSTGAYYSWSPTGINGASGSVTPNATTTYTVTFVDGHLCSATASMTVTVNPLPVVAITPITDNVCPNIGTKDLTATVTTTTTANYKYKWGGNLTVSPDSTTTSSTTNTVTATIPTTCGVTYTPSVTVTDANGCQASTNTSVVVKDETNPTIVRVSTYDNGVAATQTGTDCGYTVPDVTGSTYFTVSDNCTSNANLTITQSPTAGTSITETTTVTVTVKDGCDNSNTATISVLVPTSLEIESISATSTEICVGASTTLSATAQNGTATYTYKWYEGQTLLNSATVSPTATTTYTVVATDANGCTAEDDIEITVNALPVVSSITVPTDACPYSGSFDVSASVTGGSGSYTTYSWTNATINPTTVAHATVSEIIPVVNNQQYTVKLKVTDSEGCISEEKSESFTVKDVTNPVITGTLATQNIEGCSAAATSSVATVNTVAALESLGLAISDNCTADADLTVTSSEANTGTCPIVVTRTYTVTDKCGNYATIDQTINVNVANNITVTGGTNASTINCASDTVLPHTITPSVMPTVTDACGTTLTYDSYVSSIYTPCCTTKVYTYTYKDCAGHSKTWDYTYTISNTFAAGEIAATEETICSGGDGAEIASTTAATGCTTITYKWQSSTDNATWTDITNSNSATYTPTVLTQSTYFRRAAKDDCRDWELSTGTHHVIVNPGVSITDHTVDGSVCPDGSYAMSVTATGGVGTLTYQWYAGTTVINGATTSSYTANNITANTTYKCVVAGTTANGCTSADESVAVTVYTPATLAIAEDHSLSTICADSAFHFTATANMTNYAWKHNNVVMPNATVGTLRTAEAGKYVVNAVDNNGCAVVSDTTTVTVNALPTIAPTATPAEICKGANSVLSATGASTYVWSQATAQVSNTTVTPDVTTEYTVEGTDANGCKNTSTVTVTVDTIPVVVLSEDHSLTTICADSAFHFTATGAAGLTYAWKYNDETMSNTATTLRDTRAGKYVVNVTDSKSCVGHSDTITTTVNALPTITPDANPAEICLGANSVLSATGATNYVWSQATSQLPSTTVNPTATTTYTVEGTDANGCKNTATVTVTVDTIPVVVLSEDHSLTTICADSAFHFTATGAAGLTYAWKYNGETMSNTATTLRDTRAGKYVVNVTDSKSCVGHSDTITTTVNALPTITVSEDNSLSTICADSAFHFTATSTVTLSDYTWKLGDNAIAGATANTLRATDGGTYTVKAKDGNGCYNTDDITVTVNTLPTVTLSEDNSLTTICADSAFHFTATSATATAYTWKLDNTEFTNAASTWRATTAGKYVVNVTDANGCKNVSDTLTVVVNPVPAVTVNHTDIACNVLGTATLTITSAGNYECSWNRGASSPVVNSTYNATDLAEGWYPYTITNSTTSCTLTDSVQIQNPGAINATFVLTNDEFCEGSNTEVEITITGGNPGYTMEWLNGAQVMATFTSTTQNATYNFNEFEDGEYDLTLRITDDNQCWGDANDNLSITIKPSYHIVRDININRNATTYTYEGTTYTVPAVPATFNGQAANGCDSIISYALHQYDLDILVADTCTMTRSSYTKAYKNQPRNLYGDTIYVKTGDRAQFYAYIANTSATTWNGDTVDMGYEVLYQELPIEDEQLADVISALKISTYYDRNGVYFGRDSLLSANGEIPADNYAFRQNNNSAIQHFDYFYFDAFKNVPNKVEFTPLENGTYTFKFKAEVRHSGNTGTNWIGIYNPYIVNRTYGHLLGGYGDTPASRDTIAARTFTVIANEDGVAPSNSVSNITEYSSNASVSTYPNPVRDQLNIRVSGMEGETAITITDAQGKTIRVINVNLDGSDAVLTYDMNGCAQGMYFINVRNNENMISQKFVLAK